MTSRRLECACFSLLAIRYMLRIYAQIYHINKTQYRDIIRELSLVALDIQNTADWRISSGIRHFLSFIRNHFAYTLPDVVSMFFIIIAHQMTYIIKKYVIKINNIFKRECITSKECRSCYQYYSVILSAFNAVNKFWSIPVFLI